MKRRHFIPPSGFLQPILSVASVSERGEHETSRRWDVEFGRIEFALSWVHFSAQAQPSARIASRTNAAHARITSEETRE